MKAISKSKHSIIRICRLVLSLSNETIITEIHFFQLKKIMQTFLDEGLSPREIKEKFDINYSDFGMFLKKCLGLQLKSQKDALNNYLKKSGKANTNEKEIYRKQCNFQFDPYQFRNIPGYELLLKLKFYHPQENLGGVCRDHIVSKEFGWRNKIDPKLLAHPANCQFITNLENVTKGSGSSMNIEQLQERINNWGNIVQPISKSAKQMPKTEEHKRKLSIASSKVMSITNGKQNKKIPKNHPIPKGFWRGLTRRNKMVGEEGFEPSK